MGKRKQAVDEFDGNECGGDDNRTTDQRRQIISDADAAARAGTRQKLDFLCSSEENPLGMLSMAFESMEMLN